MKRLILPLILAVALLLFAWWEWLSAQSSKTAAKLAASQAAAAIASGSDAANTLGNRQDADAASDRITRTNSETIHKATGADAPVGAVGDAGLAGLCQRAAYRNDPRCVQQAAP